MKSKKEWVIPLLLALVLASILLLNGNLPSKAQNRELAKAVFYVS